MKLAAIDVTSLPRYRALVALAAASLLACGPAPLRIGPTLSAVSGPPPKTACEREDWYEAAPARVQAEGATTGGWFTVHHSRQYEGIGLFRPGNAEPEKLVDAWPRLSEPALHRRHQARIQPVDDAALRSFYWAIGGLVAMGAGVGTAAAIEGSDKSTAAVFGVSGLVLGLVGVVGALVSQPSGHDQLEADARRWLFMPGEDDLRLVRSGIERNNLRARAQCRAPH